MSRTLQQISDDIRDRLYSKEIIAEFVERNEDYLEFCTMIGEAFAPYVLQLEYLSGIYDSTILLNNYLISKGLITDGTEDDLNGLRDIALISIAILRSRGTLKQKLELGRLLVVDTGNPVNFEHGLLNYDKTGWVSRISSPCFKDVFTNTLNLCYARLEEIYYIHSKILNTKRTYEEILEILKQKFFPLHINSFLQKNYSGGLLLRSMKLMGADSKDFFINKYNLKFNIKIAFKDFYSPGNDYEQIFTLLSLQKFDLSEYYFKLVYDVTTGRFLYYDAVGTEKIADAFGVFEIFGKNFVLDFCYDESQTNKVKIYINGKLILQDALTLHFDLTEQNARLTIGGEMDSDAQMILMYFVIQNELFGKVRFEDFSVDYTEIYAEGKNLNPFFRYIVV